jgi:hypothetical protein
MARKINPPQRDPIPTRKAVLGSLLPKMSICAFGIKLAMARKPPQHIPNRPGQPHRMAATIVKIRAVFLFIVCLLLFIFCTIYR